VLHPLWFRSIELWVTDVLLTCGCGCDHSILCCVDILYHGFLSGLVSIDIHHMYQESGDVSDQGDTC
jgi:hypothetical protein